MDQTGGADEGIRSNAATQSAAAPHSSIPDQVTHPTNPAAFDSEAGTSTTATHTTTTSDAEQQRKSRAAMPKKRPRQPADESVDGGNTKDDDDDDFDYGDDAIDSLGDHSREQDRISEDGATTGKPGGPKKKTRRVERNRKERERVHSINRQFAHIRELLKEAGIIVAANKAATLDAVTSYLHELESRCKTAERKYKLEAKKNARMRETIARELVALQSMLRDDQQGDATRSAMIRQLASALEAALSRHESQVAQSENEMDENSRIDSASDRRTMDARPAALQGLGVETQAAEIRIDRLDQEEEEKTSSTHGSILGTC